jgi:3-deoxy-D-manno-octulosonic-acid transferase
VKIAVFNGRLSDASFRGYLRLSPFIAAMLRRVSLVAAQTDEYARRFIALGARPETVHVTGSIKFDGAQTRRDNPATARLSQLAGITPGDLVFLAGSTQAPEEQLALATWQALEREFPNLRLVIVPRHPERFDEVARMLAESGAFWQRRSRLEADGADPAARVLLVDTVGELGAWWGTAHIAFVGGSLGSRGGQNMIEPAAYGAAVSFGPNTKNFRDIVAQLLAVGGAKVVYDGQELASFVRRCLEDPAWAAALGAKAQRLVQSQTGAADRTCDLIAAILSSEASRLAA